jgi:hypothetical protein
MFVNVYSYDVAVDVSPRNGKDRAGFLSGVPATCIQDLGFDTPSRACARVRFGIRGTCGSR